MRPAFTLALVVALAGLGAGCATKIYQGPTSGRAAEAQIAVATSADRAFEHLELRAAAGKKVLVQVFGLTDRTEGESPEEAYVHGILNEKLLREGAQLASGLDDAQVLLTCSLRSAGVDVTRRDVPLIYNHHTFRALTSARVVAYSLQNKIANAILFAQPVEAQAIYRETYIFYIFGPIQGRE
jgi:acetylglutamate synthase